MLAVSWMVTTIQEVNFGRELLAYPLMSFDVIQDDFDVDENYHRIFQETFLYSWLLELFRED